MREGAKNALLYPFRNPEQTAEFGLSMAPGSGEAMAARDAWNASGRAGNALLSGDIGQAASEYGNVATGILGAIPGAGIIARGTKRGAAWMDRNLPAGVNKLLDRMTPQASQDTLYTIPAWHGSPHDFDQFKLDKIGTGEGAQAYGHGLYFAENPRVAEQYQTGLSQFLIDGKDSKSAPFAVQQYAGMKLSGDLDAKIAQAEKEIANLERTRLRPDISENPNTLATVDNMLAGQREQLAIMRDVNARNIQSAGKLYRTELDVEPEDLLDWDKPLSQQSEKVRQAIGRLPEGKALFEQEALVSQIERRLAELKAQRMTPEVNAEGAALSRQLLQERQKLGTLESHFEDYKTLTGNPAGTQALREAGIPGIRYLDQGSRGAGEGSSNFVIFDDRLVKILGKE